MSTGFRRNLHQPLANKEAFLILGFTMKLGGSDLVKMGAVLFVSHSVANRTTDALLLCHFWSQASYISDMIMGLSGLITHPGALPVLLCNLYQSALHRQLKATWKKMFRTEVSSGQSGIAILRPSGAALPPGNGDDPDLSRKAIGVAQLCVAWDEYVSHSNTLVAKVKTFLESYLEDHVEPSNELLVDQTQILWDHINIGFERASSLSDSVKHLQERAKIQVEAVRIIKHCRFCLHFMTLLTGR